jgi:hypothetical protein
LVCLFAFPLAGAFAASKGKSTDNGQVDVSLRYGCSNGGWVEARVRIQAGTDAQGSNSSQNKAEPVQIGYTLSGTGADARYLVGGPAIVEVDNNTTLVRLVGPPPPGAKVFITRLDLGETTIVPLPATCSTGSPTNLRLKPVVVDLSGQTCVSATAARATATVENPNDTRVGGGPKTVDYTVLSTDPTGTLLAPPGQMLSYAHAGAVSVDVPIPSTDGPYEVRVIGMDGSVITLAGQATDCAPVTPPTSSVPVSSTPPVSTPPTSHEPPPTSERPAGPPSTSEGVAQGPATTPTTEASAEPTPTGTAVNPPAPPTTSARPEPTSSTPGTPVPTKSEEPRPTRYPPLLANAPAAKPSLGFKLQSSAAIVVLVDALAIGGLVLGTMQVARRR